MKAYFLVVLILVCLIKVRSQEIPQNPLSIIDYGEISEISWYGWFVIIYSFFVVVIIGSAVFLP